MQGAYEEQVELIIDILPFLSKSKVFALKGGTALNFFFLDCPRLSVDIDLHYLPLNEREDALVDIDSNMRMIAANIRRAYPDTVVQSIVSTSNLIVCRRGAQVKIEPNTVLRGILLPFEILPLCPGLVKKYNREIWVPCMAKEELYAGKLCAALMRQHPRDLYDVWCFLHQNSLSKQLMDVLVVYLISQGKPIHESLDPHIKDIESLYRNKFIGMVANEVKLEYLVETQKTLPRTIVESMGADHREFLLGFIQGKPNWDLLPFHIAKELPAVRWKQVNLEKMEVAKRQQEIGCLQRLFDAISSNANDK